MIRPVFTCVFAMPARSCLACLACLGGAAAAGTVLTLAACAGPGTGGSRAATASQAATASGRVQLRIEVAPSRYTQAIVPHQSAASIATLDVVPYLDTGESTFQPISRTSGLPAALSDPDVVKATLASPSVDLAIPVTFGNLKPGRTYRFIARAYDAGGNLISTDASSSADLTLTNDDRPILGTVPLKLADTVFSASTSVTLSGAIADKPYDHVLTELFTVDGATLEPVAGGTNSVPNPFGGFTLAFSNLRPHTTYRLKASAVQATGDILATGSVDIAVTDDDAPATRSLSL